LPFIKPHHFYKRRISVDEPKFLLVHALRGAWGVVDGGGREAMGGQLRLAVLEFVSFPLAYPKVLPKFAANLMMD